MESRVFEPGVTVEEVAALYLRQGTTPGVGRRVQNLPRRIEEMARRICDLDPIEDGTKPLFVVVEVVRPRGFPGFFFTMEGHLPNGKLGIATICLKFVDRDEPLFEAWLVNNN